MTKYPFKGYEKTRYHWQIYSLSMNEKEIKKNQGQRILNYSTWK